LPLDRVAGAEAGLRVAEASLSSALPNGGKVTVVAVEPPPRAASVAELLTDLGAPVVSVQGIERIEALMRDDALGALVLSSPFKGSSSRDILDRLQLPAATQVMLLTCADEVPGRTGWSRDRNCVQVAFDADRDTLRAALSAVLAGEGQ
jgi:hypothetical protein